MATIEKNRYVSTGIICAYVIYVSFLLSHDINWLLRNLLADDAFYYFELARNNVEHNAIEFNRGAPTNGFHPLYFAFTSTFYALFHSFGINAPIYAALIFIAITHLATGLILAEMLRRNYGDECKNIALFLWLLNPMIIHTIFMGLEVTFQIFFIALFATFAFDRFIEEWPNTIGYGALLAAIFLARADGAVFATGAMLMFYISRMYDVRHIMVMAGIAILLVSPWLYISFTTTGLLMQQSGSAIRHINLHNNPSPLTDTFISIIYQYLLYYTRFFWLGFSTMIISPVIIAISLIPIVYVILKDLKFFEFFILRFDALLFGTFAVLCFYIGSIIFLREWYAMLPYFTMTITWAAFINRAAQLYKKGILLPMMIIVGIAFAHGAYVKLYEGNFPHELLKKDVAEYINTHIPAGMVGGSWNGGIIQYYTPNNDIINLDGIINIESYEANMNFSVKEFIIKKNITFIADDTAFAKTMFNKLHLNYTQVYSTSMSHWTNRWGNITENYGVFQIE